MYPDNLVGLQLGIYQLAEVTLAIGVFGLISMTVLFPVLAIIIYRVSNKKSDKSHLKKSNLKIDILIPAHNEQENLKKTIESISNSASKFTELNLDLNVIVCIDGYDAASEEIANKLASKTIINQSNKGKWACLLELVEQSRQDCDWIAFADCGAVWEEGFFSKIYSDLTDTNFVAINPGYYSRTNNFISKIAWLLERRLKQLENYCGGPISLHGACIFYRRNCILQIIELLRCDSWLNDDIVIPVILRSKFKNLSISYRPDIHVYDQDYSDNSQQLNRRRRMMYGNIQWITKLLPKTFKNSNVVGILALRRVFRVLWVYFLAFFILSAFALTTFVINLNSALLLTLIAICPLILSSSLRAALFASLISPFYLINFSKETIAWK